MAKIFRTNTSLLRLPPISGLCSYPSKAFMPKWVQRSSLLEELQRTYKVVVTGPTTLAAILNSLQMGFRTLAIPKHSGEVWTILGLLKEFEKSWRYVGKGSKRTFRRPTDNWTGVGNPHKGRYTAQTERCRFVGDAEAEPSSRR